MGFVPAIGNTPTCVSTTCTEASAIKSPDTAEPSQRDYQQVGWRMDRLAEQ